MAESVKVLVLGSVLGEISSFCEKVKTLDTKYGPFGFVICAGDFFDDREDQSNVEELLDGRIQIPKTTYIMGGEHKVPIKLQEKAALTGGELAPNLLFLDKASVVMTSQGIRIAALGGQYDPASYSSPKYAPSNHFTSSDVRKLLAHPSITAVKDKNYNPNSLAALRAASSASVPKIDILLTHATPASIALHTPNVPQPLTDPISVPLDDVVRAALPRYHFVSGPGIFWERDPFAWPDAAEEGRYTRFLSVGRFGGMIPEGQKRPRWSYAFTIVPLTPNSAQTPLPANITPNPFIPQEIQSAPAAPPPAPPQNHKRPLHEDSGEQFRWAHDGRDDIKRRKKDPQGALPSTYVCRICGSKEHRITECPERSKPPEGYVCKRCQQTGHFIRDCPTKDETGDTGGRKPPPGYVCRACASEAHLIDDCPVVAQGRQEREQRRGKGPPKEISASECWFCLSNPNLAKHLLVSFGEECYLSLPKGQLPVASAKDPKMKDLFPVPGGGHILIVPISHHPTLRSLPSDEATSTLGELERYKSALRAFYASYSCTPVFFEVAKRMIHGVHSQLHSVPIPQSISAQDIEETFHHAAKQMRIELQEEHNGAFEATENYFMVELPNGKTWVHVMDQDSRFPLQFARMALATAFGLPDRVDWKNCVEGEAKEKKEAEDFKAAFQSFDPFL
ncbi:hypothetical protein M408DRAFT_14068 [Serendipita vermifera MAFF 305830]|uniref:CCHC-type domain-containing protein n=1 Tax=Serendipita vermifera MAFF 305830 TaxID=933852 RepID=A0A0C3BMC5_SERVB|nr:hypothetical protein M408DRAFT_14068 [Serendipita vermifera MAFF 305830]